MNSFQKETIFYGTADEYKAYLLKNNLTDEVDISHDEPPFPGAVIQDEFVGALTNDVPTRAVLIVDPINKVYSYEITPL